VTTPFRTQTRFQPAPADFAGNPDVIPAATGIVVAPGSVGSGETAGSPLVVNFYPKSAASVSDPTQGPNAFTTFNTTTGEDLFQNSPLSGGYGSGSPEGFCCFLPPVLPPGEEQIGNGFIDLANPLSLVVALGRHKLEALQNWDDPNALPTWYRSGDISADVWTTYGTKPINTNVEDPSSGQLNDPSGIAIDRLNGKLYVADDIASDPSVLRGTLTRFNLFNGQPEQFVSTADGSLAKLRGLAIDPDGQYLYAASDHCDVVYKLSTSLSILAAIGGSSCTSTPHPSAFQDPSDVEVDAANGIWVTDEGSQLISFYFYPFGP
jgi:DNA-binding beta-propeller fold protein YncE